MLILFRKPVFAAVTLGHFTLDVFNNSGPVLVTFLSDPMGLTAAQIGLALGSYQFFSSLTQPLFGWLADKVGSRWLGPGSVAWTIGFLILALAVARQTNSFVLFLIPYLLASFGSSAFHPLGTKHAADEAKPLAATGTAVFFLFGQTGLAGGPILSGMILDQVGVVGIYVLALLSLPLLVFMAYAMRATHAEIMPSAQKAQLKAQVKEAVRWGAIGLLGLLIAMRSWAVLGTVSFLPKIFQDMGWEATAYGSITGVFWMSSAIAGVMAGGWADRWGRRQVVFLTLLLGSIPLYFIPLHSDWRIAFGLVVLSGGLLGASHSILVVIAQTLLPGRKAFASGVTLGYLFGTGAIAVWAIGGMADIWGLAPVIQAGTGVGIVAAFLAFFLPPTREISGPQPESVPA
jgi:FSR family fosmidomycin resistance protein-like MFS transporter